MSNQNVHDNVHHPSHYTTGEIEVINYIRDKLDCTEFTGYCIGNVIKYVSRWRSKGGPEDLEKAQVYLNWAIESANNEIKNTIPKVQFTVNGVTDLPVAEPIKTLTSD